MLKQDLFQLRSLISQYTVDKQSSPQSLDELVTAGYMKRLPVDPMSGRADWKLVREDDPQPMGTVNVHSASTKDSTKGTTYDRW
jgi:general secretion pathway protein G